MIYGLATGNTDSDWTGSTSWFQTFKYCPDCGTQNINQAYYCPNCGKRLLESPIYSIISST